MPHRAPAPQYPWTNDPILADGGACGALLRAHDWTRSPMGVPRQWPQELRVLVAVILGSMQPSVIVWGAERIAFYNDGYAAMLGELHPASLARPFEEMWGRRWDEIEAALMAAAASGGSRLDEFVFEQQIDGLAEPAAYAFSLTPVRTAADTVLGICCTCVETTWQFIARRDAAAETARLKAMFQHAPVAIAITAGPGHLYELTNDAYEVLIGSTDLVGKSARAGLPGQVGQKFIEMLDAVYRSGQPHLGEAIDVDFGSGHSGDAPRRRSLDFVLQPVPDARGNIAGVFAGFQDVTERVLASKQQELLNREIAHRMKNQLAVVNGIVSQTLRSSEDVASIKKTLGARIAALARAQSELVQDHGGAMRIGDVVKAFLDVHGSQEARITTGGPDISIGPHAALSLTLILHELGTNATKYGALSTPEGRLAIEWTIVEGPGERQELRFTWMETGGPPVVAPTRISAGTRLIRAGLSGASDCRVEIDYRPQGLVCIITAELISLLRRPEHTGTGY